MKELLFAARLKELRTSKQLTQDQLAAIFGVKGATVSRWESESIQPDYKMLMAIAIYFKESSDYLLGLSD